LMNCAAGHRDSSDC